MTVSESDGEAMFRETTERFLLLRLVTEVRPDGLFVRLEPFQRSFRQIPSDQIRDVTVTSYSATTYGGWHWGLRRTPGGNAVYRLQGDRGIEVVQTNGDRWFVGSRRPAELESAVGSIAGSA